MKSGTINTQKIKLERKKHKHTTKENHQTTKTDSKGRRNQPRRTIKMTRKQLIKCNYFEYQGKKHWSNDMGWLIG